MLPCHAPRHSHVFTLHLCEAMDLAGDLRPKRCWIRTRESQAVAHRRLYGYHGIACVPAQAFHIPRSACAWVGLPCFTFTHPQCRLLRGGPCAVGVGPCLLASRGQVKRPLPAARVPVRHWSYLAHPPPAPPWSDGYRLSAGSWVRSVRGRAFGACMRVSRIACIAPACV